MRKLFEAWLTMMEASKVLRILQRDEYYEETTWYLEMDGEEIEITLKNQESTTVPEKGITSWITYPHGDEGETDGTDRSTY